MLVFVEVRMALPDRLMGIILENVHKTQTCDKPSHRCCCFLRSVWRCWAGLCTLCKAKGAVHWQHVALAFAVAKQ